MLGKPSIPNCRKHTGTILDWITWISLKHKINFNTSHQFKFVGNEGIYSFEFKNSKQGKETENEMWTLDKSNRYFRGVSYLGHV